LSLWVLSDHGDTPRLLMSCLSLIANRQYSLVPRARRIHCKHRRYHWGPTVSNVSGFLTAHQCS